MAVAPHAAEGVATPWGVAMQEATPAAEAALADAQLPVILVTGRPAVESVAQAVEFGAFKYLIKPVDGRLLVDAVERAACQNGHCAPSRRMSMRRRILLAVILRFDRTRLAIPGSTSCDESWPTSK